MSARREAHDADLRGVDVEFGGVAAHDAQGLDGVFQRHLFASVGHAVFQHAAGNALRSQPLGHIHALVADAHHGVTAARAYHDRLTRRLGGVGLEDV